MNRIAGVARLVGKKGRLLHTTGRSRAGGKEAAEDINTPLFLPQYVRGQRYFSYAVTGWLLGYIVLYSDFGPQDHCFRPVRKWVLEKQEEFMTPSEAERAKLEQIERDIALPSSNQSSNKN